MHKFRQITTGCGCNTNGEGGGAHVTVDRVVDQQDDLSVNATSDLPVRSVSSCNMSELAGYGYNTWTHCSRGGDFALVNE